MPTLLPAPTAQSCLLIISTLLAIIGLAGVLLRRNPLVVLMSIELMLNAANLALVTSARMYGGLHLEAQVIALMIMAIAAAEVGVGLALVVMIFKATPRADVDELHELHG
ncbi:MAG: NADH-quinone oxidoreductase subunit 11 [bacterium]|nr:NADH-quinone oxidoreductase subunit 11 [bacterium]